MDYRASKTPQLVSNFLPGIELCELFYQEAVKPVLDVHFPGLPYSAALIGTGSEVQGFDDEISTDHAWGPRLLLFLQESDYNQSGVINETLGRKLPHEFRGYPTEFETPTNNAASPDAKSGTSIKHNVVIWTCHGFILNHLNFDINGAIELADWLTFPQQSLREITAGAVYHDEVGLQDMRDRFTFYPQDVWLYLLMANWVRIGQEQHLMGRAGITGDEIGSAIIGARLVRDLMRLCFLMEKQYAPYPKWFGTAFSQLSCAGALAPILRHALQATIWQERQQHLAMAYEYVAALHDSSQITAPLTLKAAYFFDRPFLVIDTGTIVEALRGEIKDPVIQHLASGRIIGNLDQVSDNTDFLADLRHRPTLRQLYE